jgi:uncharacterized protein (TIGR03437 family)
MVRLSLLLLLPSALLAQSAVQFQTNFGNITVLLRPDVAPKNVANFLSYVNSGAYKNTIFHRSVPQFVIQGGGYDLSGNNLTAITTNAAVVNEFNLSNLPFTLSMAQLSGNANSATSQWFFNTVDNSGSLDASSTSSGFTVIGQVSDPLSQAVISAIAGVPTFDESAAPPAGLGSAFSQIPLTDNFTTGGTPVAANFVVVTDIVPTTVLPPPVIGGIISASAFGGFASAAPGSFVEIYGTDLAATTRTWGTSDFVSGAAPIILDGVTVTIGGLPAYVSYISPGQVNVQIPSLVPPGVAGVVLIFNNQVTDVFNLNITTIEPGLLAPKSFLSDGKQYVVGFHHDGSFVGPGNLPNIQSTPAKPGEIITLYGLGFGPVTPSTTPYAGQIATGQSTLVTSVQMKFGNIAAAIGYHGLTPNLVGVDQFNITVPANAPSGDNQFNVVVGGTSLPQTLFIPVQP